MSTRGATMPAPWTPWIECDRRTRHVAARVDMIVGRYGRLLAALALATLVAACGGGGGDSDDRDFQLPAGTEFDTVRSGRALVVVEARNECDGGECTGVPVVGPCDVGEGGNTRGLAVYRLGPSGLFFDDPADALPGGSPEIVLGTAENPRRVLQHPTDPTLLYVATLRRIQVFRIAPGGGSACIDQTVAETEASPEVDDDLDPIDMVIDPAIGNGILYVASRQANRVDAYTIAADGTIPDIPSSCAVGPGESEYAAVALVTDRFIAVGGRFRMEIYARNRDGQFPIRIDDDRTDATCIDPVLVSDTVSDIGAALVSDMFFVPTPGAPLGQLFVAEEVSRRLFTFPIDSAGMLDDDDSSNTDRAGFYQFMLPQRRGGSSVIYSSVFNEGRVDVFRLQDGNGLLPDETFSRTAEDPNTLPVGIATDGESGQVLYVAEGGRHRIDGFRLAADGGIADLPATSTAPVTSASGESIDVFPSDVVVIPLP
jgi:hypothetical protein